MANVTRIEHIESDIAVENARGALRQAYEQARQEIVEHGLRNLLDEPGTRGVRGGLGDIKQDGSFVIVLWTRLLRFPRVRFRIAHAEDWSAAEMTERSLWWRGHLAIEAQPHNGGCMLRVNLAMPWMLAFITGELAPQNGNRQSRIHDMLRNALAEWERMARRFASTGSIAEEAQSASDQSSR